MPHRYLKTPPQQPPTVLSGHNCTLRTRVARESGPLLNIQRSCYTYEDNGGVVSVIGFSFVSFYMCLAKVFISFGATKTGRFHCTARPWHVSDGNKQDKITYYKLWIGRNDTISFWKRLYMRASIFDEQNDNNYKIEGKQYNVKALHW